VTNVWRFRAPKQTNVVDIYDDHASSWWNFDNPIFEPLHAMVPARLAYLERHKIDVAGKLVVDAGCGGGYVAGPLAARGARVVGFDIAPRALRAARDHDEHRPLLETLAFAQASALALPVANNSVDVVVSTDVLVHLPPSLGGARAAIAEAARVLRPGGVLWFSTINATALARLVLITLGEDLLQLVHKGTHEPATFITPAAMTAMCADVGLDLVSSEGVGPVGVGRGPSGRFTLRMGHLPTRGVMWQGHAVKR
jgi:2-polyprenyl-6-hydroxyphenyl methylase/3-demethylubiquinone-9 3-methyltransferase